MKFFIAVGFLLFPALFFGQILTVVPARPNTNDSVVITYSAKLGNGELAGFTGDVYAHAGLILVQPPYSDYLGVNLRKEEYCYPGAAKGKEIHFSWGSSDSKLEVQERNLRNLSG